MRFSTRTRYGLRFLVRLAEQPKGVRLQLAQVAREENISPGYLEQIVRALKPLNILCAARGAGGGYTLAKSPEEINLEDIFLHLEGEIAPVSCLEKNKNCLRMGCCTTRTFWQKLDEHMRLFLHNITLQQFIDSEHHF
ncbi:MAG: Rrf2 family transcriptional regulator [Desulfovibrionaceae bacterium]|nr:Rrf2 family transcriptional regulator [Desulfovibrionaceae bacterium]